MGRNKREKNTVTSVFSQRLKALTNEKKDEMNQKQGGIARSIDIPSSSFSAFLSDAATPGIDTLHKICRFFEVSADYLLGLSDAKTPDIDKQAIHAKTQLSEKAVEELTDTLCMEESRIQPFLNAIIESPYIFRIAVEYNQVIKLRELYINSEIRHKELMGLASISEEDGDFLSDPQWMKQADKDNMEFAVFQLNKVWMEFLNDITKVDGNEKSEQRRQHHEKD